MELKTNQRKMNANLINGCFILLTLCLQLIMTQNLTVVPLSLKGKLHSSITIQN